MSDNFLDFEPQVISVEKKDEIISNLSKYKTILVKDREQKKEVMNLANGVYAPLQGFLKQNDFQSVVKDMKLSNGEIWSIPITFDIGFEQKKEIEKEKEVVLLDEKSHPFALIKDIEIYDYDKIFWAKNVFGTNDKLHPGVEYIHQMNPYLLGGTVWLLNDNKEIFPEHNFTPAETRKIFKWRGWQTIVGFQTRNIPHIGHEFLQKTALEKVDGLFIQPVIGEKKLDDFKDEYIISSYEVLIDKYFPKNKVVLGILPLKMRYAGPREAVFHALIRRNYGCTHFIVGRDHAGVGNYYGHYEAQEIFDKLDEKNLGIKILRFPEVVLSKKTQKHCFITDCPNKQDQISFSGTKLRTLIKNKEQPPDYIIRPEVYNVLVKRRNVLVDDVYKKFQHREYKNQKGFVLWFTGLSQSGKSTIAEKLYEILEDKGVLVELLDGDIVRETLTSDLGFTKKDRDENIRRVGFVVKLLSHNNVGVLASFISPYKTQRDGVRIKIENFLEIFVNTPLDVCEKRDRKGLYALARKGEVKNFTGISDPYENPENPEIEVFPAKQGVDECVEKILNYLEKYKFI